MQEAAELPCVAPEQAALEQAVERFDRWQARPRAFQGVRLFDIEQPRHECPEGTEAVQQRACMLLSLHQCVLLVWCCVNWC